MVLNSTRRLQASCVLARRSGVISRQRLFRYRGLAMEVHCQDHPLPYQIGQLTSKQLLIQFLRATSTVTPKRSTIFCSKEQMLNKTFVTSRQKVKLIVLRGRKF